MISDRKNNAFYYCNVCIVVLKAEVIGQSWSSSELARRYRMATLDEIGKEKQRISEALVRVDAQREKLAGELSELEATERVLARYSKGTQSKRTAAGNKAAAPVQSGRRRRATAAKPAGRNRSEPSFGDRILALANGKTQQEIAAACKGVRPNHIGIAIARHSGQAASRSAMASSMRRERQEASSTPRSEPEIAFV